MWTYHPDLLAGPVPRYTSYPTAAQFSDAVGADAMLERIDQIAQGTAVSLYLHIPYCHDICWYCGCNTGAANRSHRLAAYVDALEQEIAAMAQRLGGRGHITRIAFGGGSPNSLPLIDFVRLLQQVVRCFDARDAQISVELDPRRLDRAWIDAMGVMGVGRVNLGVQTFTPAVQARIGRIQPLDMVERAVERFGRIGIAVGFDLMYGLPGQSLDDLAATLEATVRMAPARIALFGYAHMPRLLPRQRRIDASALPDMEARFAMAALGHDQFAKAGYQPIGFDHFSLPGDSMAQAARRGGLRRNFQGFTDDDAGVLIGMGASAISAFPDLLVQNEKAAGAYRDRMATGLPGACRGMIRTPDDQARGRVIESLLCRGEADAGALPLPDLSRFEALSLLQRKGSQVILQPTALPYARAIASTFDAYLQPQERRFSHAI